MNFKKNFKSEGNVIGVTHGLYFNKKKKIIKTYLIQNPLYKVD